MKLKFECNSIVELPDLCAQIFNAGKEYKVWIFDGEMGAGKTAFIHTLVENIGTPDLVNSPSYSIINEYLTDNGKTVYHFDFFRLTKLEEALDIGFEEFLDSGSYCFIEWPDIIRPLLPEKYLEIHIKIQEKAKRILKLYPNG